MSHDQEQGKLLPGDIFTLGWSFYEERQFILKATVEFSLREALETYWSAVRDNVVVQEGMRPKPGSELDLREGMELFGHFLEEIGLAVPIKPVFEICMTGTTGSNLFSSFFTTLKKDEDHNVIPEQPVKVLWPEILWQQ